MQIRQFEYVREIAATGSITQAAQKLFVSQQALSEMLKLLEKELGFRIFERSSRGVKPTKAGEKFLLDLEKILPIVHAWDTLKDNRTRTEPIKIWLQYVIKDLLTSGGLIECAADINEVQIDWDTVNAREVLDLTIQDKNAIGILNTVEAGDVTAMSEKAVKAGKLSMEVLLKSPMAIVFAKDDELSKREILTPTDLCGKYLVHNHQFGSTPHLKHICNYTNNDGILLPETVNTIEYLLRHKDTFSYMPEIVLKYNYHVVQNHLCVRYLENDTPYWLCVLYHDNNDAVYAETVERIMEYFERYD